MIYTDSKHLFFSVIQPHTRDGGIFFTFLLSILFLLSMLNQVLKYFCIHLQRIILAATLCVAALLFGCTTAGKVFNIIKESIRIIILARTELSPLYKFLAYQRSFNRRDKHVSKAKTATWVCTVRFASQLA